MKLSFDSKKVIVDELRYVANSIRKEAEITKRVYVYSAAYAVVNRILNIEFDPDLVLIHSILQSTYTEINNRLNKIVTGAERVISIDASLFDFLAQSLQDLADVISEDGDIAVALAKIAIAGYATTGNGYYLYQKGILRLYDNR